MIKSFYLRLFFLGLPGVYLALWLSRFSLSMVNAIPYYYGMIMTAASFFCGMLISYILYPYFRKFFNRSWLQIFLIATAFLASGDFFKITDAGMTAKYELIYYFAGLSLLGFLCCLCMQYSLKKEKNTLLGGFITGSVIAYFIGVKYFEQSHLEIYLGIPVVSIALLNQLLIFPHRSFKRFAVTLLLAALNIFIYIKIYNIQRNENTVSLTNIGYSELKIQKNTVDIIDHRRNLIRDIKNSSLQNIADLPVYQLQTDKDELRVLFIGYPGSITPVSLFRSPFVKKLDMYFWDLPTPKGFLKPNIFPYHFYLSEWNFLKKFKIKKYDLIVIENIPEESESCQRIFIHYAKRLLKQPHGVIAFPENLGRKYDGQYIKATPESSLIMLMGGESTEDITVLEKRGEKILRKKFGSDKIPPINLTGKIINSFNTSNSSASYENTVFSALLTPAIWRIILWCGLGLYLVWRLFKCRYRNNQNGFFAFEAGFTFCIVIFSSLMLLSELRLVYPCFTPALFGISVMVMLPLHNKKTAFIMQAALAGLLFYFSSINFIRAFPPIYIVPVLLPLSFTAIADTLNNCSMQTQKNHPDFRYIFFTVGILLTLLLLLCAKNNNLYPTLIYIALISRILYYFKI